jgi:predicted KAP-like P-loop ATPase
MKWLSDEPIESNLEDKLNFDKSSNIIKELIIKSDTPLTIGINGKWGSGKTSLMRLIREKIENIDDPKILISWFETWNYVNEKEIWRILLISLIDGLDPKNKNFPDITNFLSSILNLGFITTKAWLSHGATIYSDKNTIIDNFKNVINNTKSREELIIRDRFKTVKSFKNDFEKIVEKTVDKNGKFVIFIDDLDRIDPEKVVEVIEAIKTFLSCKRCVFVIGCDYDYLNTCIEHKFKGLNLNGREYIEKIVQIPFRVPNMGPQFSHFLSSYLKPFFHLQDEFVMASDLINKSVGRNPRKIKRLVNLYTIIYNLNNNELNNILLFKLLCFMSRWPNCYKEFYEYFYRGINKFYEYEQWALPTVSFNEFIGFPEDLYREYPDEPPDPDEDYNNYIKKKERTENKINKRILELTSLFFYRKETS